MAYTEVRKECNERWRKKQDVFQIRFQPNQRARALAICEKTGESLNQFVLKAINQRLESEE